VKIKCEKCGEKISRITDVGSPWLDAGIVPFSTLNYFEDKSYWKEWFPADFITESFPGQFKNWFYSLIAMSTALEGTAPFKNLLGHGQVRDEKGEEMHKSKGNSIEFNEAADKIGVDVMRWLYLRSKPEHNINFGYHVADEIRRLFLLRLWNVYVFFTNYALLDRWKPKKNKFTPENVIDRWMLSRLNGNIRNITNALDGLSNRKFDATDAIGNAEILISDLSNWYVRRIRDRVGPTAENGKDKDEAYQTLWQVLVTFSKVLAPMVPFISEEVYRNLTGKESVHLADWPDFRKELYDVKLEGQMCIAQRIVEEAHSQRKENKIKVRQPLASLTYEGPEKLPDEIGKLIGDEVNIKKVIFSKVSPAIKVTLDFDLNENLIEEGQARDLVRQVQELRKNEKLALDDKITIFSPSWPKKFEEVIKKETLATSITKSDSLKIKKNLNA
jgi:isoleucyl-tRNA synthetase